MKFEEIKLEELPDYGDIMTIKDWIHIVDSGGFIDYDGHGNLAMKDKMSELQVKPSFVKNGKITKVIVGFDWLTQLEYEEEWNFTHIVWFNR